MIIGLNDPKSFVKHVSCNCKYRFDRRKCNSNQKWS